MTYKVTGALRGKSRIEMINTQSGAKQKLRFTLVTDDKYPQTLEFELFGDKVSALDGFHSDDKVEVEFAIKGRDWTSPKDGSKRVFMSLSALSISRVQQPQVGDTPQPPTPGTMEIDVPDEDLPF